MASIIDSIRSVYTDNYSLLKLGAFSYAVYLIYKLIVPSSVFNIMNIIIWLVIAYIYLGFSSIIISNRINQRIEVLPALNPATYFSAATKSTIIALPFAIIGLFVVGFVVGLFNFEGLPQQIAIWMIRFFVFCSFITALINLSEKFNISDGFNIPKILSGLADVLVYTLLCLVLIALYSLFTAVPTLYLIYSFFEIGPIFEYVAVFFLTLNMAVLSDYWGQLHFDIESKDNYY